MEIKLGDKVAVSRFLDKMDLIAFTIPNVSPPSQTAQKPFLISLINNK